MTATPANLILRQSISTAVSGDSTAVVNGLGRFVSQTAAPVTLNAVFSALTQAQNAANQVSFRCVFVGNSNTVDSITNLRLWMTQVAGGANAAIGLDPTGLTLLNSAAVQALAIANVTTVPPGVTFTTPASGSPLIIPVLGPRECFAVWVRRTAVSSGALASDGLDLVMEGTV